MIQELQELLPEIHNRIRNYDWDSLVINRRKPHTYRAFMYLGNRRVCLHRFDPCEPEDCFLHPHPWPGAFLMLAGEYVHNIGYSPSLEAKPLMLYKEIVRPYTAYEIANPQTWHSVQPLVTSYTIMLNGEPWEIQHSETRTTKGKDLDEMNQQQLDEHLNIFDSLLSRYLPVTE